MKRRRIRFADCDVVVEWEQQQAAEILDFLYRDVDESDSMSGGTILRLTVGGSSGWELHQGDNRLYSGPSKAILASVLIGQTIHHLTADYRDGMAFHAAAVSRHGRSMLLPGRSGAGKTSLAAWLTANGFNYLTDELVFIERNTCRLDAFTRPLCVKERALLPIREAVHVDLEPDACLFAGGTIMIPHRLLNEEFVKESPQLAVILFPSYQSNAEPELVRLSKAQVGLALMEHLVNARNLSDHGFSEAIRLAQAIPAYRLTYSHFDQLPDMLQRFSF